MARQIPMIRRGAGMRSLWKQITPRDKDYKKHIEAQRCCIDNHECFGDVVMHHENEPGKGMKGKQCSDYRGIPLCYFHHGRMEDPGMGRKTFWAKYGKDPERLIAEYNQMWRDMGRKLGEG
jgi:hypothetical protein